MQFFARNRISPDYYGTKVGGCLDRIPPHSEFEGTTSPKSTCITRNTTFESLNVQIRLKLRRLGWPRKKKIKKKGGIKTHKTVIFHRHVEAPLRNRSAPYLVSLFTDVITPVQFASKVFIFFVGRQVEKTIFPLESKRPN